jgi:hypothetical protein
MDDYESEAETWLRVVKGGANQTTKRSLAAFMRKVAREARAEERERCAKVADEAQGIATRQAELIEDDREECLYLRGKATAARHVAVEIRALPPTAKGRN